MNKFNPDTYCGIYCGACSIAKYSETGLADQFATCLRSVPKKELACSGCKSDTVYTGCSTCGLRRCARKKKIEHCIDCADYPCKSYNRWQTVAKFLPHAHEAPLNLETIKREGVNYWLNAEKKHWECPDCGTPFSWYVTACHNCDRSLLSKTFELSAWRKVLCRLMLTMAYRKAKAKNKSV